MWARQHGLKAVARRLHIYRNPYERLRARLSTRSTDGALPIRLKMIQGSDKPRIDDPAITAILPCKNGAAMVRDCLEGLAAQDIERPFEVILIDGWWDDDVAAVASDHPFVHLVRSDENLLQARARNVGVERARSDYVAFIDADCVPEPGWLRAAADTLDTGVRMVGGPVLDALPENPYAVADNYSQFAEMPATRPAGPQDHFPACNVAMRRDDFFAVGGFPHTGVPAGEDTLLCFAVTDRFGEGAIRFCPAMRMRHRGRETRRGFLEHQRFFGSVRAGFGIKLSERRRRLGQWTVMVPVVMAARLRYMLACTWCWAPRDLPRVLRHLPLIVWGLGYWALGFRDACRKPIVQTRPALSDDWGQADAAAAANRNVNEEGTRS